MEDCGSGKNLRCLSQIPLVIDLCVSRQPEGGTWGLRSSLHPEPPALEVRCAGLPGSKWSLRCAPQSLEA
eukprot:3872905-Amphidinium_carterae.1